MVWVSSNPYQLGEYVAYNLKDIFKDTLPKLSKGTLSKSKFNIEKDVFQYTKAFKDYETYRILKTQIEEAIANKKSIDPSVLLDLQNANPEYWEAYYIVGEYYYQKKYYKAALNAFEKANTKEITTIPNKEKIEFYTKKLKRKLKRKLNL